MVADDAMYLLMADYFSPYYSSLSRSAAFVMQKSQFPPLYPILLAMLGAGSEKILLAHVITTSCFLGAVIIYAFWVSADKVNKLTGACLSLIIICLPASFIMNIDLWSEHLYMFFTMCALFFVEKADMNNKYWLIASLFIGLMPLVRLTGIVFLFSFLIYLHIHKIHYRYRYILISILPILIWKVVSMSFTLPEVYESTLIKLYQNDIWLIIKNLFSVQLLNLWSGWHECFDIQKNFWSGIVCASILLMASVTWVLRLIKKRLDSLYLLFYLMLIWLWPAHDHDMRFMFVVFPILLYYSYLSLSSVLKNYATKNLKVIINYASIIIILATFSPTNLYAINRLFVHVPSELKSYRNTKFWLTTTSSSKAENSVKIMNKMILSYIEASKYVPEDKCVYSVHQEQFMFYTRRLAYPLPLPEDVMDNDIIEYLGECEYIHVLHTTSHPYFPGGYPIDRLNNNFDYLMLTRMSEDVNSPVVGALLQLH